MPKTPQSKNVFCQSRPCVLEVSNHYGQVTLYKLETECSLYFQADDKMQFSKTNAGPV